MDRVRIHCALAIGLGGGTMHAMNWMIAIAGWIAWAGVAVQAIVFLVNAPQCVRAQGSLTRAYARSLLLLWTAVVLGIFMGHGRVHLAWLFLMFLSFPDVWHSWWVRLGFGFPFAEPGYIYALFLVVLTLCVSDIPTYSLPAELARLFSWSTDLVHCLVFTIGLGIGIFFRWRFKRLLVRVKEAEQFIKELSDQRDNGSELKRE